MAEERTSGTDENTAWRASDTLAAGAGIAASASTNARLICRHSSLTFPSRVQANVNFSIAGIASGSVKCANFRKRRLSRGRIVSRNRPLPFRNPGSPLF